MGVPVGEAEGDHPSLLRCNSDPCGGETEYETDETMPNDCPECDWHTYTIVSTDPNAPWRDG